MPDEHGWDNNFGNNPAPTRHKRALWECSKCHEHFYLYIIERGTPVCHHKVKDCPAKQAAPAGA